MNTSNITNYEPKDFAELLASEGNLKANRPQTKGIIILTISIY